ncbi:MAG TPA: phage portal protein [Pseudoflavonifractor sp.]|nr:phage portal protein [Pseudoflavonifractor sp.]
MMLGSALRPRNAVEVTELDYSALQAWFQKVFFAGEEVPTNQTAAERLSPIAASHRILTNAMSVLPIGLYQKKDGARTPVNVDDVDYALKVRANEAMSPSLMRKVAMSQGFWHGVSYIWKRRDARGRLVELIPLPSKEVTRRKDPAGGQIWYGCTVDGVSKTFAPYELIILFFETYDGIHGRGVLDMARELIATDGASQRFAKKFYANGAKMSGVVEVDGDLGKPGRDRIKGEFKQYASGGDNEFRVAVLDRGMKYTPMGLNQSDAQFIESRNFSVSEASRFTGVPEFMLQAGKQAYNSNQQQQLSFVTNTLMAHVVHWEQEFGYKLLTTAQLTDGYYARFNLAALLRGDDEARAKFYQLMVYTGIYNQDECRAFEEMNPIPGGLGQNYFLTKNLDTLEHIVKGSVK